MDKALKQRLVGASVLIALAVVVLPMLLSGGSETRQESRAIELPPKPRELAFETRRFPIGEQASEQPSELEVPTTAPTNSERAAQDLSGRNDGEGTGQGSVVPRAEEQTLGADPDPVSSQPGSAPTGEAAAPTATGRYLVQVASFSSSGNANRLTARLRESGMPVLTDTVDSAAGVLHRVRIGPYGRRSDADEAIATLNGQMPDLSPRVIDLRPEEAAPVNTPSDPLVRWVVQVGSFSERGNAEQLVYRLRDAGYSASSEAITGQTGTAYKVRVGPVIAREDAFVLAETIRRDLGLDGLVMSAD